MNYHINRRHALMACVSSAWPAKAQSQWPQRPVRIVVPFAPGAGTDAMGRLLALKLSDLLGGHFVVENKAGASGAIGAQQVAQSTPDGHTLLLIAAPFTTVAAVMPQAGYDPIKGFTPISMVAQGPLLWVAHKDLPIVNLRDLVNHARSHPGRLNYGSAGAGGINHLLLESLKAKTGIFITHIPYRGIAPATLDLLAGQIDVLTGTVPALSPYVRDGRLKALAVTTSRRSTALPDVPSMSDLGWTGDDVSNYFGLVAPKGTPQLVVDRIQEVLPKLLALPDVQARFSSDALEPAHLGPAALTHFLTQDFLAWQKVVTTQGIRVDQL